MLLLAAACFVFVSCGNQTNNTETTDTTAQEEIAVEENHDCANACKSECEALQAAWADWANQTPEQKAELIAKKLEKAKAFVATEETCPNKQAEKEAFAKLLETIDVNDVEAAKAILDQCPCNKKCHGEGEGCHKEGQTCNNECGKDCKTECCKDQCKGADCKHDCKK